MDNCSRWYGEVIGVNDISCTIGPGVTALLGQNGAGKSTIMNLITGQLRPTAGSVRVFGMDPFANPKVAAKLGFCPDLDAFPEGLTGEQFLIRMAELNGMNHAAARSRTAEVLVLVGMDDRSHVKMEGCSKGMRQRIKLAAAMLHDPELLLLDEPLNGLDPVGRREFMDLLRRFSDEGRSIVVSSHILFEVEQMTRSILLMHHGRLLASGDISRIRELMDRHPHRVRIITPEARKAASLLLQLPYVVSAQIGPGGDEVELQTRSMDEFCTAFGEIVTQESLPIRAFESPDDSLEAVFGYLVQQ